MEVKVLKAFRDAQTAEKYDDMDRYRKNDKFKSKDYDRIKELQKDGYLEKVEMPTDNPENNNTENNTEAPAVEDMNMDELRSLVKENNIEVEGTGKNGTVTRKDIEKALDAQSEEK